MALVSKITGIGDSFIQTDLSPPITPLSESCEVKSFRTFFEENMLSSRKPISHDSASVLLLSYDSDEKEPTAIDVREEVKRLEDVFRKDYRFHVEQQLIMNNTNAQLQMFKHLTNFTLQHGHEHALLIVYYAGHGWRSEDERRSNPGRFDFYPKKLEKEEMPSRDKIVMWEVSETILHHVKGDVLVIFDCCDAGSLAKLRSAGRAFEYLGACEENKYTHNPGKFSFTSALTWALKELSTEPPFTTDRLVSKIKEHMWFPDYQKPVLFTRWDYVPEHIWISNLQSTKTPTLNQRRSSSTLEFRDDDCDFVDFRVTFSRPLSNEDGKAVADLMKPLVCNRKLLLNARHVSFLRKGTCKPSGNSTALWTRVRNHLIACHRIQRSVDSSGTMRKKKKKRQRPSVETDSEDHGRLKYAKSSLVLDIDHETQFPLDSSPELENHGDDLEETLGLRINTSTKLVPRLMQTSYEIESDPVNRIEPLLRDLERLKQDILHQPEIHSSLKARVWAVLGETR